MADRQSRRVVIGKVTALFGVKGWVKLLSWTDPREDIVNYPSWQMKLDGEWCDRDLAEGRPQGKTIIARLEGITDRDQAVALIGAEIAIRRDQLPPVKPGEYYWDDLIGMEVRLTDGRSLGRVEAMMETGANDVLVVKGEHQRLIPFIREQVVREVDMEAGLIRVDWDADF
ncbi:MAG TPA: ribosome maturation factor RimM [Gammaproteobacteria bacterium]|nr:ribosome maturation factor RimM [Gammaproteobacteria bacterium]